MARTKFLHLAQTQNTHPIRDAKTFKEDTSSYENINPVIPPERIAVKNNTAGYKFIVPKSDFFGGTKFIASDLGEQIGTSDTAFGDFVFR